LQRTANFTELEIKLVNCRQNALAHFCAGGTSIIQYPANRGYTAPGSLSNVFDCSNMTQSPTPNGNVSIFFYINSAGRATDFP
jgi:hypothetical protein